MIDKLDKASNLAGILVKAATAFGAILLLIYCSSIEFYPSGVTLGDTLLFLFLSLGFSFVYGLLFYLLFCMGSLLTPFARWVQKFLNRSNNRYVASLPQVGTLDWSDAVTVVCGGMMLLILLRVAAAEAKVALGFAAAAATIFFWWTIIIKNPRVMKGARVILLDKNDSANADPLVHYKKETAWVILLLIPFLVFQDTVEFTLKAAAKLIGIRAEHVTVIVEKDMPLVQKYLASFPTASELIKVAPGETGIILKDVDILFQGIGTKALISVKTARQEIRVSLPSEDVKVISAFPAKVPKIVE